MWWFGRRVLRFLPVVAFVYLLRTVVNEGSKGFDAIPLLAVMAAVVCCALVWLIRRPSVISDRLVQPLVFVILMLILATCLAQQIITPEISQLPVLLLLLLAGAGTLLSRRWFAAFTSVAALGWTSGRSGNSAVDKSAPFRPSPSSSREPSLTSHFGRVSEGKAKCRGPACGWRNSRLKHRKRANGRSWPSMALAMVYGIGNCSREISTFLRTGRPCWDTRQANWRPMSTNGSAESTLATPRNSRPKLRTICKGTRTGFNMSTVSAGRTETYVWVTARGTAVRAPRRKAYRGRGNSRRRLLHHGARDPRLRRHLP